MHGCFKSLYPSHPTTAERRVQRVVHTRILKPQQPSLKVEGLGAQGSRFIGSRV